MSGVVNRLKDHYRLEKWVCVNLIIFKKAKFKVLYLGLGNLEHEYRLSMYSRLRATLWRRILRCCSMRSSMWACSVSRKSIGLHRKKYGQQVEEGDYSHLLLYCENFNWSTAFRSQHKKNMNQLELVRRGLEYLSYEERLRKLGLFSLEKQKLWEEIIMVYPVFQRGLQESWRWPLY